MKEISSHLETTLEINARVMPYIDSKMRTSTILKRAIAIPSTQIPKFTSHKPIDTVAQKGHTCKFKMLLQIENFTCKLKMLLQIKKSTCKLKMLLQIKKSTCKLKLYMKTKNITCKLNLVHAN